MKRQERDYIRRVYAQYREYSPGESEDDRRAAVAIHLRDNLLITLKRARELVAAALPRRNPAKLERCVRQVKARNRRARRRGRKVARSPYAVCTATLKKAKRRRRQARANPGGWYIHAQRMGIGPVLLYNGRSFSNVDKPLAFPDPRTAVRRARAVLRKHRKVLRYYKIWVADVHGAQAVAGRRVNPDNRALDEAARKLEDFTGHEATHVERARARSDEKTGLVIGELDLIGYRARREGVEGGKMTRYAHKFRAGSRPLLAVSTDGKQLHVVGGLYEFTEAGIEDR